uniref:Uncharacterized protein n=1 Tax=Megaselia scalaris TaxID=36166 RepID=T1GYB1_MEGSC
MPSSLDIFAKTSKLQLIDLSGNDIEEPMLKRIHFKSLHALSSLDLSRNTNINGIDYLAFKFTALKALNMSSVRLMNLNKLGNDNITNIDFSNNEISQIPVNSFEDLKNLITLNLSCNNILELKEPVFRDTKNLKELRLQGNNLRKLDFKIFQNLVNLETLDLSSNCLESIPELMNLIKLQNLFLQDNFLKIIPSNRALPITLKTLDISNNSLRFIGKNTFQNIQSLNSLDISYTNNTYIDFDTNVYNPFEI